MMPHLCYGTPYHLNFCLNQLHLLLNINLNILFFVIRHLFFFGSNFVFDSDCTYVAFVLLFVCMHVCLQ